MRHSLAYDDKKIGTHFEECILCSAVAHCSLADSGELGCEADLEASRLMMFSFHICKE